jgi:hypothetical protein
MVLISFRNILLTTFSSEAMAGKSCPNSAPMTILKRIQVVRLFRFHTQYVTARIAIHRNMAVIRRSRSKIPANCKDVNDMAIITNPRIYDPTLLLTAIEIQLIPFKSNENP